MLHTTNYDLTVEASELLGISSHTKYHQALWGEEPRVMTVEVTVTETGNIAFLEHWDLHHERTVCEVRFAKMIFGIAS